MDPRPPAGGRGLGALSTADSEPDVGTRRREQSGSEGLQKRPNGLPGELGRQTREETPDSRERQGKERRQAPGRQPTRPGSPSTVLTPAASSYLVAPPPSGWHFNAGSKPIPRPACRWILQAPPRGRGPRPPGSHRTCLTAPGRSRQDGAHKPDLSGASGEAGGKG